MTYLCSVMMGGRYNGIVWHEGCFSLSLSCHATHAVPEAKYPPCGAVMALRS